MNMYKKLSRYLQKRLRYDIKHVKKQVLFTSFRDFTVIFLILFLTDFDVTKSVQGHCSRSMRKSDLKTCITALNTDFLFDLFYLVT